MHVFFLQVLRFVVVVVAAAAAVVVVVVVFGMLEANQITIEELFNIFGPFLLVLFLDAIQFIFC